MLHLLAARLVRANPCVLGKPLMRDHDHDMLGVFEQARQFLNLTLYIATPLIIAIDRMNHLPVGKCPDVSEFELSDRFDPWQGK